jgi:hypothetical protein
MTDVSSTKLHDDHALAPAPVFIPDAPLSNGYAAAVGGEVEDDSTIKCICGYNDDDGNTVFCEDCNTWQHIECYYPNTDIPDVHQCVDCKPRSIDVKSAADRQRQARIGPVSAEKKAKRGLAKPQKKKAKDPFAGLAQINGAVQTDQLYAEQPPAKRPKTNHRTSSSTTSITQPSTRKRASSTAIANRSPTKSPSLPTNGASTDQFSPEFMRLYASDCTPTKTNSFSNLSVPRDLSNWLSDVDQLSQVTNGKVQQEVFQRWDQPWEELERASPGVTLQTMEDTSITAHGRHPVFQWLTAQSDAPQGAFLGELNGQIGRIDDYTADPSNRWDILKHPEPFVFFHDKLPICIDTRAEGSPLRYVRRSCQPNAGMQIVIVQKEYHFCIVSTERIQQGKEITIGWNMDEKPQAIVNKWYHKKMSQEEGAYISSWISRVLANFGGCACGRPEDFCLFGRLLRRTSHPSDTPTQGLKPVSRRKGRKGGSQISPLGTGLAINSRAGSETIQGEPDDEVIDSRSTSGSSRSKASSRDITPLAHFTDSSTGPIGLGVELSSREQKKLLQQERLFEQMEHDGSKKKKRNSAGSALNTPTVSSSVSRTLAAPRYPLTSMQKQLGFPDSVAPSPTSASSSGKARINGQHPGDAPRSRSLPTAVSTPKRHSKPVYTESATQTEVGADAMEIDSPLRIRRMSKGCSFAQRLLRRTKNQRAKVNGERSPSVNGNVTEGSATPTPAETGSEMQLDSPTGDMRPPPLPSNTPEIATAATFTSAPPPVPAPAFPVVPAPVLDMHETQDVEMEDVETNHPAPVLTAEEKEIPLLEAPAPTVPKVQTPETSHPPIQPPPPPWPIASSATESLESPRSFKSPSKPPALHVQLPPIPTFSAQTKTPTTPSIPGGASLPNPNSAVSPGVLSIDSPTVLQSPLATSNPLFSPSIANVVAPSPMKKKLSLSDYTNRKKKIEAAKEHQQARQGSPLTHTTSTSNNDVPFKDSPKEEKPDALTGPSTTSTGPNGSQAAVEGEPPADNKAPPPTPLPAPDNPAGSASTSAPAAESTAMEIDDPSKSRGDDVKAKTTGWWNGW